MFIPDVSGPEETVPPDCAFSSSSFSHPKLKFPKQKNDKNKSIKVIFFGQDEGIPKSDRLSDCGVIPHFRTCETPLSP